jgi:hypothetical protein
VFDADLLGAAVDLTHSLDARFGKPAKRMVSLVRAACLFQKTAFATVACSVKRQA